MNVLVELTGAIDALCAAAPAHLADRQSIQDLHRQLERLHAATTRATAAFEAGGSWEADGARSAAAWLATRLRTALPATRRRLRLGRALRHMAHAEAAWLAGAIDATHVAALAQARSPVSRDCFEQDEAMLVDQAAGLSHRHFARALAYWCQRADPDGTEDRASGEFNARRLHLSQSLGGGWVLDAGFDPIGGAVLDRALRRIEAELVARDWAEARARVGEGVCAADLARRPAQRRADAAVEMARRAGAMPPGARLPEPLFSVLVGYETFAGRICELAEGTVVSPGSLLRWLDEAWVERVVFDGRDRVRNLGVRRRVFTGATRRAIEVRDRECFHEFCEVPAEHCQIDHVEPYSTGGPTVEDNGRLACGYHNRLRHRRR
jgi:Domain of unknown function (DUF222)/HNH endonuclease